MTERIIECSPFRRLTTGEDVALRRVQDAMECIPGAFGALLGAHPVHRDGVIRWRVSGKVLARGDWRNIGPWTPPPSPREFLQSCIADDPWTGASIVAEELRVMVEEFLRDDT